MLPRGEYKSDVVPAVRKVKKPTPLLHSVENPTSRKGGEKWGTQLRLILMGQKADGYSGVPSICHELRSLGFASQGALQGLIQGCLGFFVLLLTDETSLVLDFEFEEFFFQAFE